MRKLMLPILLLSAICTMVACYKTTNEDINSNFHNDSNFVEELSQADNENSSVNSENTEISNSNWVEFDECFYGVYSNAIPFDDGVDENGNTIWGAYDGSVKISKDCISIDVPEGKYELTPENSYAQGDNYISFRPFDKDWSFIVHNKENLQAGYMQIQLQTATNQYLLYKE